MYRHFPLTDMHPDAKPAAEASEAAHAEGKFWEMHDAIFESQNDLSDEAIVAMAEDVGLDSTTFRDAWESGKFAQRVDSDAAGGSKAGVHRTPTFFINGVEFDGDSDEASLDRALAAALKA